MNPYSEYDAIIIGGGLTGCVIARRLAEELDFKVLIVEKREHISGNLYDYIDENKILVQKYGPHSFHTNNDEVYEFITKYHKWENYKLRCMVNMCGKTTPSPFNFQTIDDYFDKEDSEKIKSEIFKEYGSNDQATIVDMLTSDNKTVKKYAYFLFEHDYSIYTAKQWGISASEIDVSVLKRVPVVFSYRDGYYSDKHQILPAGGFTAFIESLIDHDNIDVELTSDFTDYLYIDTLNNNIKYNESNISIPIVYTGELDKLLEYRFGRLPYRSLIFNFATIRKDLYQPVPIVAYPEDEKMTRITEYKHLPVQVTKGVTTIVKEYPAKYEEDNEPYYPILTESSIHQYKMYKGEIAKISNLYVCGRLGDFKYYNMDQAIERAFEIFEEIKSSFN